MHDPGKGEAAAYILVNARVVPYRFVFGGTRFHTVGFWIICTALDSAGFRLHAHRGWISSGVGWISPLPCSGPKSSTRGVQHLIIALPIFAPGLLSLRENLFEPPAARPISTKTSILAAIFHETFSTVSSIAACIIRVTVPASIRPATATPQEVSSTSSFTHRTAKEHDRYMVCICQTSTLSAS